jgi:hypothetical protein
MSWDRFKGQWKLQRGKAVTDDGVASSSRKHEDRVARHQEKIEIAANHAPIKEERGRVSNFMQDAIQRLKNFVG